MTASGGGRRGRPSGQPKSGGRVRGTPNRATVALREKLAALGCDPVADLVGIAKNPETGIGFKVGIYALLLRHTVPTPKPIDDSNVDDATTNRSMMTPEEALRWARYVIERFGPNPAPQKEEAMQADENTDLPDKEEEDED